MSISCSFVLERKQESTTDLKRRDTIKYKQNYGTINRIENFTIIYLITINENMNKIQGFKKSSIIITLKILFKRRTKRINTVYRFNTVSKLHSNNI